MHGAFAKNRPVVIPCKVGFSFFFDLIQKEWGSERNVAPIHRICSLMRKMGAASMVREELELNAELQSEVEATKVRTGGDVLPEVVRLSFFRENLKKDDDWHVLIGKEVLGYVTIAKLTLPNGSTRRYILESVVRPPTVWLDGEQSTYVPNYYLHCSREFKTVVGTAKDHADYSLWGSFFCQQNDLTHICAHAALRMAINNAPRYAGSKVSSEDINKILGIDHKGENCVGKYGAQKQSTGLKVHRIAEAIKQLGWDANHGNFVENPAIDYEGFVYSFIESGCPVILGIVKPKMGHVVTVLGHTLNSDRWTPEARIGYEGFPISPYIGSWAWADHFIVSDDNYGMYVTLPSESIRNVLVPKYNPDLHASEAIALVPTGVQLAGYASEEVAALAVTWLIEKSQPPANIRWFTYLKEQRKKHVCRTLLCSKTDYVSQMVNAKDESGNFLTRAEEAILNKELPDRFWVTEITLPNLYTGNKHKLGDVVSRVNGDQSQFKRGQLIDFIWLPGIHWRKSDGMDPKPWSLRGHIPLLPGAENCKSAVNW